VAPPDHSAVNDRSERSGDDKLRDLMWGWLLGFEPGTGQAGKGSRVRHAPRARG